MALTIDSTLGELLNDEKAKAVLEKHIPDLISHPQIGMATGMTLGAIAPMSQGMLTDAQISAIAEDLSKL